MRLALSLAVVLSFSVVPCKKINYINEPVQLRINSINLPSLTSHLELTARVSPSGIVVPGYLSVLRGQCFSEVFNEYRYTLCPFQNASQYEQSFKWNPYKGIIGVWKEWKIHSNEFKEMMMPDGDACGDKWRQTKVRVVCLEEDSSVDARILSVEEPATCDYLITLGTHLVCFNHSLNVYPFLPQTYRERWDELEGRYQEGELTEKGYESYLRDILTEAGFLLSDSDEERRWNDTQVVTFPPAMAESKLPGVKAPPTSSSNFKMLSDCNKGYLKLKQELESLQREVALLRNSSHASP